VRDVLGADGVLGKSALEGGTQCMVTVTFQQLVEARDIPNPYLGPPVSQLGQILERAASEPSRCSRCM
jgi:hypothetical protein